jgi:hypothetical protein
MDSGMCVTLLYIIGLKSYPMAVVCKWCCIIIYSHCKSLLLTNRLWVTWHCLPNPITLWITDCGNITCLGLYLIIAHPMSNRKWATLPDNLITLLSMINRKWVTLLFLAISNHLKLWPTGSMWHCTLLCKTVLSHGLLHDQQKVSDTTLPIGKLSHHISYHDNSLWATLYSGSPNTSHPMTDSQWVTLHCHFFQAAS